MTGPVSGFGHHFPAVSGHLQPPQMQGAAESGSGSTGPAPGNGHALIHNRLVPMTAMNTSGLTSAFATADTMRVLQRNNVAINPRNAQAILNNRSHLAAKAERDMDAIANLKMNNFPYLKEGVERLSRAHASALSPEQQLIITEAIRDYQGTFGDNFLMNISAMGYRSLEHYLQSRHSQYHDSNEVDHFVAHFADHYGALTGRYDEQEELDELKTRLADCLTEPTQLLQHYIHSAPRITAGPLLKGALGLDNPVSTQLDGDKTLHAILNGKALHFNGFLSTTSDYDTAIGFSGNHTASGLGKPLYTINLTENTEESEVLRRATLHDLQSGNVDTGAWLLYLKSDRVAGVSLNATEEITSPDSSGSESGEDEILLAPGHYFQPEQVIRNDAGIAVIGNLKYGRD